MYAVVEFPKKEVAIVPMTWLIDNSKCYWPKTNSKSILAKLVNSSTPPQTKWPIFPIEKLLYTNDNYIDAEQYLNKILEGIVSSDGYSNSSTLFLKSCSRLDESSQSPIDEIEISSPKSDVRNHDVLNSTNQDTSDFSINDAPNESTRIVLQKSSKRNRTVTSSSESEPSSVKDQGPRTKRINTKKNNSTAHSQHCSTTNVTSASEESEDNSNLVRRSKKQLNHKRHGQKEDGQTSNEIRTNTPTSNRLIARSLHENVLSQLPCTLSSPTPSSTSKSVTLNEKIISLLENIKVVQEQNTIKIDQILRTMSDKNVSNIVAPNNTPNMPISHKSEFTELEFFLNDSDNFKYMKLRLSAIGGSSVRITTMNIMKFIISNKVAMKFNWSGRDKKPFKNTKTMEVIYEAVKFSYGNRPTSDLNDVTISAAVKDWLKLAKQRYLNSKS